MPPRTRVAASASGSNLSIRETDDAHLLCLDARSGNLLWDVEFADKAKHYGATSAPLVVKDTVIVGTSGGDSGVRGFRSCLRCRHRRTQVAFVDNSRPRRIWLLELARRFLSAWRWHNLDARHLRSRNSTPCIGPRATRAPDFVGDTRPGDDLYTACVLAIDANTGKLKWYFQFTPHDLYDYDANETPVLLDSRGKRNNRVTCWFKPIATVFSMFSTEPTASFCGQLLSSKS